MCRIVPRSCLLLLAAVWAHAQPMPWIDISGEWKMMIGDDARFAEPDFDDSGWRSIKLPGPLPLSRRPVAGQYLWLRRSVDLAGRQDVGLVLTLGKLTENYQLFVNGKLLASVGDFTIAQTRLARPRSFDLPRFEGPRMVIAVRAEAHQHFGLTNRWILQTDDGPYAITGAANAPRSAGDDFLNRMRLGAIGGLVAGVGLLGLSLVPLLMYLYDRSRLELLWLGLHALLVSARRLQVSLFIEPDTTPFHSAVDIMHIHFVLLLEFVATSLELRVGWFRALAWGMVPFGYIRVGQSLGWNSYAWTFRVIEFLSVALFVWASLPRNNRKADHWLILASAAMVFYAGGRNDLPRGTIFAYLPQIPVGDSHAASSALFTLIMVLVLTRRLLADRMEKQRLADDLEAARVVQNFLLSSGGTGTPSYAVETAYLPAQEVGGDCYQVLAEEDGGLLVLIADVSGKGLRAAMVVSMITGVVRARRTLGPAAMLRELNAALQPGSGGFVTCLAARLRPDGEVILASAGHPAPYRAGEEAPVESGLPLGVIAGIWPEETRFHLQPGETLTFVTDGVVEAANARGELFGFERTREATKRPAAEIAEAARAWGQNDDITVITVRARGSGAVGEEPSANRS